MCIIVKRHILKIEGGISLELWKIYNLKKLCIYNYNLIYYINIYKDLNFASF